MKLQQLMLEHVHEDACIVSVSLNNCKRGHNLTLENLVGDNVHLHM